MSHSEIARQLFLDGYNCSQAVLCAFEDVTGLDRETAAKLSSSFGGGMGRMREVCGCVSGALMVLGMVCGYGDPEDQGSHGSAVRSLLRFIRIAGRNRIRIDRRILLFRLSVLTVRSVL